MAGIDKHLIFLHAEAISHPGGFTAGTEKNRPGFGGWEIVRFGCIGQCGEQIFAHEPLLPEVQWTPVKGGQSAPRTASILLLDSLAGHNRAGGSMGDTRGGSP